MNILRNLRRRSGRTTLITLGIGLAIAFSIIMLSIGEAIQSSSRRIIEETGVDIIVEPNSTLPAIISQYTTFFEINNSRTVAEDMMKYNPKIRAASPWLTKNLYMAKESEDINLSKPPKFTLAACNGFVPENNQYFGGIDIVAGTSLPTRNDPFYANNTYSGGFESENFTHEILISKALSNLLDASVGDTIYINPIIIIDEFSNQSIASWYENASRFKIHGIIISKHQSQNALIAHLHLSELQYITGTHEDDTAHKIYVKLYHKSDRDEVKNWLTNDFIHKDKITAYTPEDLLENLQGFMKMFEGFSKMVVIITMLVATLFISTVLMISTRERSSEIGALRAIGISRFTINKFIFFESLVICILALIFGIILGYLASNFINDYIISTQPYLPPGFRVTMITFNLIAQVTIITLLIALLASLGPSYWAMRLKPVETLRNE